MLLPPARGRRARKLLRIQLDDEVLFHGEVDVVPGGHGNDGALEGILVAVSYTHLDVYKRQGFAVLERENLFPAPPNLFVAARREP